MNKRIISNSSLVIGVILILIAFIWLSKFSIFLGIIATIFFNIVRDVERLSIKFALVKAITNLVFVSLVILKLEGKIHINSTSFYVLLIAVSSVLIYKEILERNKKE